MLAAVGGMAGCGQVYVSDNNITGIDRADVAAAQKSPTTTIVDVRKPESYAAGHIPGAINIYLPDIQSSDPRLGTAQKIIVYCDSPTDPLARAAAKRMLALGYKNVDVYQGGLEFWKRSGEQVVKSTPAPKQRAESGK